MRNWPYNDNMWYDDSTDRVILHTPDEDFYYFSRQEPMGVGGMGYVLRGWSLKDHRAVAIKRVHNKYSNIPEIRERARNEAKLAFRHPNLVEMLGMVESKTGKGPIFIISNMVNGVNMDTFVSTHLSGTENYDREKRIVNLMLPVLEALKYIHSYNIYHLDIKPSNIMVEMGRNVRLMDLGIALPKSVTSTFYGSNAGDDHASSSLMGTPRYAAPEQFGLSGFGEISSKSDIYEFGITLYELITGFNPFKGISLGESMELHKKLILPQHEKISQELLQIIRVATHPRQDQRQTNVEELLTELKEYISIKPSEGKFKVLLRKIGIINRK